MMKLPRLIDRFLEFPPKFRCLFIAFEAGSPRLWRLRRTGLPGRGVTAERSTHCAAGEPFRARSVNHARHSPIIVLPILTAGERVVRNIMIAIHRDFSFKS
jgi:hypothetical protein